MSWLLLMFSLYNLVCLCTVKQATRWWILPVYIISLSCNGQSSLLLILYLFINGFSNIKANRPFFISFKEFQVTFVSFILSIFLWYLFTYFYIKFLSDRKLIWKYHEFPCNSSLTQKFLLLFKFCFSVELWL